MIAHGRVQNGVVVLPEGVRLPEGQLVTVSAMLPKDFVEQETLHESLTPERRDALQRLIGIWKSNNPPNDDQVEQILRQERMKKYD